MTTQEEYLTFYRTLTDAELSARLDLINSQLKTAFEKRNDAAMRNLQAAEAALIQARMEKLDKE